MNDKIRKLVRKILEEDNNLNDNFQKWFSGSKVIDKNGEPLVVYHGTSKKFSKFNLKKGNQPIIWFTSDKSTIEAGEAGAQGKGHVMDLYASIKTPAGWPEYEKYGLGQLKGLGYDGAILSDPNGTITGFVFEPNQLKSIKNKGEWDSNNKNIFKEENLQESYEDVGIDFVKNELPKLYDKNDFSDKKVVGYFTLINKNIGHKEGKIIAYENENGTEVGNSYYGGQNVFKATIDVRPDVRRMGIATEIYKFIEELTGQKLYPDTPHSEKAEKFWNQPNRQFGHDLINEERQLGKNLADQINTPYVVIYRAAPINANEFFDRDFITLSKKFAIEHAEHNNVYHEEPQHVIQALVSTKNVYDAYNPGEYFYSGPNKKAKEIYTTKGHDYEGLNESARWSQGGIILIKGEKLQNGKQKLYANIPKQIIEAKSGTKTTREIEKFVLGKEFYRIRYNDKGDLKAFLVERPNNIGIDKNTNIVYKNENKIPLHWETLKFNNIGTMIRSMESQILRIDNIELFN